VISQWVEITEDLDDDTPLMTITALISGGLALVIEFMLTVPALGVHPFGRVLVPVAVVVTFSVALTNYRGLFGDGHSLERVAVAVGMAYAAFLISSVLSLLLDDFFVGLHMADWAIYTLVGVYGGGVAHLTVEIVRGLSLKGLFQLLVVTLSGGFVVSMISVGSPDWWRDSLSWMGYDDQSGYVFNSTLIVSGMVLGAYGAGLVRLLRAADAADHARQLTPYLMIMAIGTMGIGLFPMRVSPISQVLHDGSAFIALGAFVGFALTLARQQTLFSARFRGRCVGGVVIILVMGGLYLLQIANYTFSELAIIAVIAYLLRRLNREMYLGRLAALGIDHMPARNSAAPMPYQNQRQMETDEQ